MSREEEWSLESGKLRGEWQKYGRGGERGEWRSFGGRERLQRDGILEWRGTRGRRWKQEGLDFVFKPGKVCLSPCITVVTRPVHELTRSSKIDSSCSCGEANPCAPGHATAISLPIVALQNLRVTRQQRLLTAQSCSDLGKAACRVHHTLCIGFSSIGTKCISFLAAAALQSDSDPHAFVTAVCVAQ
eukprot:2353169-Pleurochrysis_carterae.AAC.2